MPANPRLEYGARLLARRSVRERLERRSDLYSNLRMAVFLVGLAVAAAVIGWELLHPAWIAVPAAVFAVLVALHGQVRARLGEARRAEAHYDLGLARLDGTWMGRGTSGEGFADPDHPYAQDLDLFGEGSLFERLCLARTLPGERTLAAWLTRTAGSQEVRARQGAVQEWTPRLDLREELELLGRAVRAEVDPERLTAWAAAAPHLPGRGVRFAFLGLTGLTLLALLAWTLGWLPPGPFLVLLLAGWGASLLLGRRIEAVTGGVERPGHELEVLALVLARLEREPCESPRLRALQATLTAEGQRASRQIHRLMRLVDLLEARLNQFFVPIALLLLWSTHLAFAIEAWRLAAGSRLGDWLAALGELEALGSLAGYAFENPEDPFPELVEGAARYEGVDLGHPLLPRETFVRNDVSLGPERSLLVVSGSNMSGKSTLLRTVGSNAVLALAGAPVRAKALRLSPLVLGATLRIQDSLREGASRFYAEITRLKQIVDLAGGEPPLLFLLDEVLSGTNSHDRRIGAESILRGLLRPGAVGLVTTHDLALADIAEALAPRATNVHFEDRMEDDRLVFDYRMRPGVVERSNAIALMRAVGLEVGREGPQA